MTIRRFLAAFTAAVLLLFSGCTDKQPTPDLPKAEDASAAYDPAGVLSPEAENYIVTRNDALFALTGAQIVVACVDSTGSMDIADFAYHLFNSWGIGSAEENNGILVLLSIGEDDYWTLQGEGLEDTLPSGLIKTMQNTHLEPDFAVRQYEDGVRTYFDALVFHLETLYSVDLDTWNGAPGAYTQAIEQDVETATGTTFTDILMIAIVIVIIVLVVAVIVSGKGGGSSHGGGSSGHKRTPTVTIPRTVMRGGYYPNPRPTVRPPTHPGGGSSFGGSSRGGFSGGSSFGGRISGGPSGGFRGGGGSSRGGGAGRR